ncbi:MAG: sensor histidine kinase [Alphaproteobacteria bacterium]|nr:sensor histidine kinase [Alphaproteobacteria bacterium]
MTSAANNSYSSQTNAAKRAMTAERVAKLKLDQLQLVVKNIRPGMFGLPMLALAICFVLAEWVPLVELEMWFGAVLAVTAFYAAGHHIFLRRGRAQLRYADRWTWILSAQAAVFNVVWVLPPLIFWSECSDLGRMFLLMVYACNMAGAAAITSPCKPCSISALITNAIAIILPPLLQGGGFYYGIAFLAAGFSFFMAYMAQQVYATTRDMLLLREDKNDLIEQLTAAKIESDKARYRAEAASHAKSEFLANMSHELRTPLNAILGFSEIMKGEVFGPVGSPQYSEYAAHIHSSGEHLLGLINDVLDLSRIEAGRFVIKATEIDLKDEIAGAINLFAVRAAEGKVDLQRDVENDLPLLIADERAVRQVLLNLISNAIKFTPENGTVTIFARRNEQGGLDVGVTDSGVGIAPEDVPHVFEAFGQGQHDLSVKEKGTGLGLPIVRGLVEAHGGKVGLTSEVGKGTTVTASFPRERLTAPQPVPIRLTAVI